MIQVRKQRITREFDFQLQLLGCVGGGHTHGMPLDAGQTATYLGRTSKAAPQPHPTSQMHELSEDPHGFLYDRPDGT